MQAGCQVKFLLELWFVLPQFAKISDQNENSYILQRKGMDIDEHRENTEKNFTKMLLSLTHSIVQTKI